MKLTSRRGPTLVAAAGMMLFLSLVVHTGVVTIFEKARIMGLGFLAIIFLSGIRMWMRTIAWRITMVAEPCPSLLELFGLRLMAEAITDITPAGPLLGETTKAWAVSKRVPAHSGVSSIVIEDLIYTLATGTFMVSGITLLLWTISSTPPVVALAVAAGTFLLVMLLLSYWLISRRSLLLTSFIDQLRKRGLCRAVLDRYRPVISESERNIYDFLGAHKEVFLVVLLIEVLTNFTGIGEAYLILKATTAHASFLAAYFVESANRAVHLFFAFVPFGVGVEEGAAGATLQALHYSMSDGVSLAIIRKGRRVFWIALGVLIAPTYFHTRTPLEQGVRRNYEANDCQWG